MLTLSINQPALQQQIRAAIASKVLDAQTAAERILETVGAETVAYLRSLTEEMRPPARKNGPERPAHPGHWADRTGQLALSYAFDVVPTANGARLTLSNSAEYAVYLERRNGFYILSGVTDPGGPVETQLRAAVAAIEPTWEVRLG